MPALTGYDIEGVLTVNGTALNTPAWMVGADEQGEGSLTDLWGLMSERRGEDRILPSASGVIAYPRRKTATPYALRAIIIGDVNSSGVANADDRIGLQTNLATWRTLINTSSAGTSGTVTASLTLFSGGPLTGPLHVLRLERQILSWSPNGKDGSIFIGTLHVSVPAGSLV